MAEDLTRETRPFIDLIDKLRRLGVQQDLPLPQIAVMGDQSAGKSSVLELISGVPFPRGSGLVTRCATQLVMKRTAPDTPWSATASVSWKGPQPAASGTVASAGELGNVILALTEALCANSSSAFSTDAIVIELRSPEVPDLTLLDLPGIVRTAVAGQDASVVGEVNGLIESYLKQERTIVLAVMPSNQDVATIDILERAAIADPLGERTLAVLTKPDLIDQGAEPEVGAVLANKRKPLRLGYAMVLCRSQRELNGGVALKQCIASESAFFKEHSYWGSESHEWKQTQLGVTSLTRRLSTLLVDRIKVALPSIKYELQQELKGSLAEYASLGGDKAISDAASRRTELVRIVAEFTTLLRQSARGNYGNAQLARRTELRLFGEAQSIFKELKEEVAASQPRFQDDSFTERLATEMAAFRGRELPGFTNSQVFYGFMVQNIEEWRPHVEACRQHYVAAARTVAESIAMALTPNYPALGNELRNRSFDLMDEYGDAVHAKLDEVFAKEADPYTTNESMLELINSIRQKNFEMALQAVVQSAPDSNDDAKSKAHIKRQLGKWYMQTHGVNTTSKVEDMCTLLAAYWDVATKRLVDNVCMTLEHNFVAAVLKELESCLFLYAAELSAPDKSLELERLFKEDPATLAARKSAKDKKIRLELALDSLLEIAPDVVALNLKVPKTVAPKIQVEGGFANDEEKKNADNGIDVITASSNAPTSYAENSLLHNSMQQSSASYQSSSLSNQSSSVPPPYSRGESYLDTVQEEAPPPPAQQQQQQQRSAPPPAPSRTGRAPPPPLTSAVAKNPEAASRAATTVAQDPVLRGMALSGASYAAQNQGAFLQAATTANSARKNSDVNKGLFD